MPLKAAEAMRDSYANEIARAVHAGMRPDPFAVEAWERYDSEAKAREEAAARAS